MKVKITKIQMLHRSEEREISRESERAHAPHPFGAVPPELNRGLPREHEIAVPHKKEGEGDSYRN